MGSMTSIHCDKRNAYKILVGKPAEGDHLEDLGIGGRIMLE
jgi:hypothetical protein